MQEGENVEGGSTKVPFYLNSCEVSRASTGADRKGHKRHYQVTRVKIHSQAAKKQKRQIRGKDRRKFSRTKNSDYDGRILKTKEDYSERKNGIGKIKSDVSKGKDQRLAEKEDQNKYPRQNQCVGENQGRAKTPLTRSDHEEKKGNQRLDHLNPGRRGA